MAKRRELTPEEREQRQRDESFDRMQARERRQHVYGWSSRPGAWLDRGHRAAHWDAFWTHQMRHFEAHEHELGARVAIALTPGIVPQHASVLSHANHVMMERRRAVQPQPVEAHHGGGGAGTAAPDTGSGGPARTPKERFEAGEPVTPAEAKALPLVQGSLF